MRNVQAWCSLDTFADEIVELAASRVFAILPFGYGHDPDATGLMAAGLVTAGVLVLHASSGKPAVTSRAALKRRPAEFIFI